jgi:polar amino acid transport system permease protein
VSIDDHSRAESSTRPSYDEAVPATWMDSIQKPTAWAMRVLVLVLVAMLLNLLITSPSLQWDVVAEYFTSPTVLLGVLRTLGLTFAAMVVGVVIGAAMALMRMSRSGLISGAASLYIWFFRGTPLLVQIIFWFNLSSFIPTISLGIPFGPSFVSADVNTLVTPFVAAILGLGLNEGAYMSEIVRAGITSVDSGQTEAAHALGMTQAWTMRRIVLPQAMRIIIPPTGNQAIGMLKSSSLVSVIAMAELLYTVQTIYARTFQTIPLLVVASIWYLILTTVFSWGQYYVERHYSRGSSRALPPTPFQRARSRLDLWAGR